MNLYIYIDESGIIPKPETKVSDNDNFIMAAIITTEQHKLKRHFRKGIKNLINGNDKYAKELNENSEIKGSHIPENKKTIVFEKIFNNCADYTEIGNSLSDIIQNTEKKLMSRLKIYTCILTKEM